MLEFTTIYGGLEPSRNRVVVPARYAGEIDSLHSISGLLKSLKIRAQRPNRLQEPSLEWNNLATIGCRAGMTTLFLLGS